jgi:hypothetical protein
LGYAPVWDEDCGCCGCLGEGGTHEEGEEGVEGWGEHDGAGDGVVVGTMLVLRTRGK